MISITTIFVKLLQMIWCSVLGWVSLSVFLTICMWCHNGIISHTPRLWRGAWGTPSEKLFLFIEKNKGEIGNQERNNAVFVLSYWETKKMFQNQTCIRQLTESIQFSIQFSRALWSLNKTTKDEYGFIKFLCKLTERTKKISSCPGEKCFGHQLAWKRSIIFLKDFQSKFGKFYASFTKGGDGKWVLYTVLITNSIFQ